MTRDPGHPGSVRIVTRSRIIGTRNIANQLIGPRFDRRQPTVKRTALKKGLTRWIVQRAVVLLAGSVFASLSSWGQVNQTLHDMSSTRNTAPSEKSDASGSVCVFCHTPHGADSSASAPLWRRTQTGASSYTTFNSLGTSSLDGASAPVGSVSVSCLSCHDGVQAMNMMINVPAPGLASARAGTSQTPVTISAGNRPASGVEARSDHPFGIQYAGGALAAGGPPAAPAVYSNTRMKNQDFSSAQSAILNEQSVWWVDTAGGVVGGRDKNDIQLYTREAVSSEGAVTFPEPFVECASCHDPHIAANSTFLRITNAGSAVCLACHNKQ